MYHVPVPTVLVISTSIWEVNSAKIKWCTLYIKQVERRGVLRPSGGGLFRRVEGVCLVEWRGPVSSSGGGLFRRVEEPVTA